MIIIDDKLLNNISTEARENDRLRKNFNLHNSLDDKVQQLLNALEPGTELPIHRHLHTHETYILIRGYLKLLIYNDSKILIEEHELSHTTGKYGVRIPNGTWHSIEVLETGTVIFEVKEGPYTPLSPGDML